MNEAYAVLAGSEILYQTEGFTMDRVTARVPLSGGATLLICGRDDASLARQLREAEEAVRAKDTFLSNMSHDIRTPMNAITGLTLLARMHIDEPPRVLDALDKIETASGHLLGLINDVLDMSYINSGKLRINNDYFSLNDLIHECMTIVRPQADKKGHRLSLRTADIDRETLKGDQLRLRQVLVNIISNAIKYTPDGGQIDLRFSEETAAERCTLIFVCRDNGIGMSEEFLKRVFEPFERVNTTTVSRIEGTGLGMSIVRKLTEAMDGTVDIVSAPDRGTTVTVRVPLEYREEPLRLKALKQKRVLIAEADDEQRDVYDAYLTQADVGHTLCASAADTLSALADAEFAGRPYDAVIIGSRCQAQEDRLALAAYLHKNAPNMPILLCGDDNWEEIGYRAEQSGVTRFIPLPLFRTALINGLSDALTGAGDMESRGRYPDLQGRNLLLVEDNLINREIVREILGVTGAAVTEAENGAQAVDVFARSPEGYFSAVLMDVQMPVMDGYEATRRIRRLERPDADLPVYAMTANTFAEDIRRARDAGMNGHIAKPVDVNALMQALSDL